MIVLLDSDVLGMATNPKATPENVACANWVKQLIIRGDEVRVPDITDYELRRILVWNAKRSGVTTTKGIRRLDELRREAGHLPLDTDTMLLASDLWAQTMFSGRPLADPKTLNADVILAAQAYMLRGTYPEIVIASGDPDLTFFDTADVKAMPWRSIP